jgi:hypothetical protein
MKVCHKEAETIGTIGTIGEEPVATKSMRETIVEAIDAIEAGTNTMTDGGTIGATTTAGIETTVIAAADTSQAIEMIPAAGLTIKIIDGEAIIGSLLSGLLLPEFSTRISIKRIRIWAA